ncbi:ROK family protein [Celeribacter indicus]|uniref:N-acetylglucosamine kinase n=1 Tax=Celeribacter indicus TaxID=1208324 RepID=A0A0B5E8S9_9RHOB|nr:ROK family protein [Celeribacter indicus]AJE48712.1 N-acetyl-D-glucosamine kinase [Celeribacter indicus]SDX12325.1 N-acetylglucosamine kinase [Celeribacter indicus]
MTTTDTKRLHGGIDLGGTKIEAALFDRDFKKLDTRRLDTPRGSYEDLLAAIDAQYAWLSVQAQDPALAVGIGLPGYFSKTSGLYHAANLPASGRPFRDDLTARLPHLVIGQDLKCFALSEARGGAGDGARHVFGLIMGTGLGGAYCVDGHLVDGLQGLVGEVGHLPIGAATARAHDLPQIACGCGRIACLETLVAGPGLERLARHLGLEATGTREIFALYAKADAQAQAVVDVWLDLCAQTLLTIQMSLDPDVIVLGGGLSNVDGVERLLEDRLSRVVLRGTVGPSIRRAKFGDASGVRGAAMLTQDLVIA